MSFLDLDEVRMLLPFCRTARQTEVIQTVLDQGTCVKAAEIVGTDVRCVQAILARVRKEASRRGYSHDHKGYQYPAPDTHLNERMTRQFGPDGLERVWVKDVLDKSKLPEAARAFVEGLAEEIEPIPPRPARTRGLPADLANLFVITDYHLGMLSWAEETGQDWDLRIATDRLKAFILRAVAQAPRARTAVLAQLGDYLHFDGLEALTPTGGHVLDADSRFHKVVAAAAHLMRWTVETLLEHYELVHVIVAEGNHDLASSAWLQRLMAELFRDEPRVEVDVRPDPFYCFAHGRTLLFFHHGHKRPPKNVDTVLVAKFQREFGQARHVYAHMGHLHNELTVETNLMLVRQHRTLASRDAYASRSGWMSKQSADVITYHAEHGEVSRLTLTPELLELESTA